MPLYTLFSGLCNNYSPPEVTAGAGRKQPCNLWKHFLLLFWFLIHISYTESSSVRLFRMLSSLPCFVSEVLLLSVLASFCFNSRSWWFNVTFITSISNCPLHCNIYGWDTQMNSSHLQGFEQIASFPFSSFSETWQSQCCRRAAVEDEVIIQGLKTVLTCTSQLLDNSSLSPTIIFLFSQASFILLDCLVLIFNPVLSLQNAQELWWCFRVGTASIFKLPSVLLLVKGECLTC